MWDGMDSTTKDDGLAEMALLTDDGARGFKSLKVGKKKKGEQYDGGLELFRVRIRRLVRAWREWPGTIRPYVE